MIAIKDPKDHIIVKGNSAVEEDEVAKTLAMLAKDKRVKAIFEGSGRRCNPMNNIDAKLYLLGKYDGRAEMKEEKGL